MAHMIPMMLNPAQRQKSSNLIKYLIGFGVVGVAIIAFIFIAKKWKPLSGLTKLVKGGLGTLSGVIKGASVFGGAVASAGKGFEAMGKGFVDKVIKGKKTDFTKFGVSSRKEYEMQQAYKMMQSPNKSIRLMGQTTGLRYGKSFATYVKGMEDAEKRRTLQRVSPKVARGAGVVAKMKGLDAGVKARASIVGTAFRSLKKVKTRKLPERFNRVYIRKSKRLGVYSR